MDFKKFCDAMLELCRERLPETYDIRLNEITKNNGHVLTGITAGEHGRNIHPTVYLNEFFEAYERGVDMDIIEKDILNCISSNSLMEDFNIDFINDYEYVGKSVVLRVINYERNREFLKDVPYMKFMDLAIVFYIFVNVSNMGPGSILIKNEYLENWNVDEERLYSDALNNTRRLFSEETVNIKDMLNDIIRQKSKEGCHEDMVFPNEDIEVPMYVITNRERNYGANMLLYMDVLGELSEKLDDDLYILPSSVHELIAVPVSFEESPENLVEMVRTVNATEVSPDQVLSDNVYVYHKDERGLQMAAC